MSLHWRSNSGVCNHLFGRRHADTVEVIDFNLLAVARSKCFSPCALRRSISATPPGANRHPPELPLGELSEFFQRYPSVIELLIKCGRQAMPTHRAEHSMASRSLFADVRSFAGGFVAAVALLAFISGFGASDLIARSRVEPPGQTLSQTVNSVLKGDRLPLAPAFHRRAAKEPLRTHTPPAFSPDSELPEGCEPPVSPLADFHLARVAGRCVS